MKTFLNIILGSFFLTKISRKPGDAGFDEYSSYDDMDDDEVIKVPLNYIGYKRHKSNTMDFNNLKHRAHVSPEFSYHVVFLTESKDEIACQGALISTNWVLTSGLCIKKFYDTNKKNNEEMIALVGITNIGKSNTIQSVRYIKKAPVFYFHREDPTTLKADFALVNLSPAHQTDIIIKPIKMASQHIIGESKCHYSTFDGNTLYGYSLKLIDMIDCLDNQNVDGAIYHICAGSGKLRYVANNVNEFGSPLMCNGVLYGIKTSKDLFTNINNIVSWVEATVEGYFY